MKLLSILGLIILVSCKSFNNNSDNLKLVSIDNCNENTVKVFLPAGWNNTDRLDHEDGFIQSFRYNDNMYVAVLCGGNAVINSPKNELNYRREIIDGITIIYANITDERKPVFEKAFNYMLSE